jgi:nitrous oxide reductase
LNGDIKDNQRQGLSMLAATFTTIHESITEWKNERERRSVRSPRAAKNTETNSEEHAKTRNAETQISEHEHVETKDNSQQTEHVFSRNENDQITPLLEKYSELLVKKFEDKMNN